MNKTQKIFAGIGVLILVIGALIIRQNEAGYISYLKGDYKSAERAFRVNAEQGHPWGAFFVGSLNDHRQFSMNNPIEAAKAYLQSAKLGNIDGAIKYIKFIKISGHTHFDCSTIINITDKGIQTHHFLAVVQKAFYLGSGICFKKDNIQSAHYTKWGGELVPSYGSAFVNHYNRMAPAERKKFDTSKFQKPSRISDKEYLKFFFSKLGIDPAK